MNLQQIALETEKIAKKAARFIQKEAKKFDTKVVEYKEVNNVVSYVDKEAERLLVKNLRKLLPEAGFITEENTATDRRELNWIIDPLDGTANFIHGLPVYSVSVALARGSELLVGVVYHVVNKESFVAWQGGGAYCNGSPICVSKAQKLGESLLATGFPYYKFENQDRYLRILEALMQKTHGLRRMGSAAIDLAYVACGRFDGFYEYNLNSWDMAAGVLLVQEAGGSASDFSGKNNHLFGGDVVVGNPPIHAELLKEIQHFWVLSS